MSSTEVFNMKFAALRKTFIEEKAAGLKRYIIGQNFNEWNIENHNIFSRYAAAVEDLLNEVISNGDKIDIENLSRVRYRFKEDYWTELVQTSRRDIEELKTKVNHLLMLNNGTDFLQMAYEEVLFPVFFSGKKKYFGYAHMGTENFYPEYKEIFIRGIEIIKQGQTKIAKEIGMTIINEICSIKNDNTPLDIVINLIPKFYERRRDFDAFAMTAKNKPPGRDKVTGLEKPGNIMVKTFVQRMKELSELYAAAGEKDKAADFAPPEVGDKFSYVVVKKSAEWSARGKKKTGGKGSKIEFLSVVKKYSDQYEIDISYYMENSFAAILARFISYEEMFLPPQSKLNIMTFADDEERSKFYDEYAMKEAKRWVIEQAEELSPLNFKKSDIKKADAEHGRALRKMNREAVKISKSLIEKKYGNAEANFLFVSLGIGKKDTITGDDTLNQVLFDTPAGAEGGKNRLILIDAIGARAQLYLDKMAEIMIEFCNSCIDDMLRVYGVFEMRKMFNNKNCMKFAAYYRTKGEMSSRRLYSEIVPQLLVITTDLRRNVDMVMTMINTSSSSVVLPAQNLENDNDNDNKNNDNNDNDTIGRTYMECLRDIINFNYLVYFYSNIGHKIDLHAVKLGLSNISLDRSAIKKLVQFACSDNDFSVSSNDGAATNNILYNDINL